MSQQHGYVVESWREIESLLRSIKVVAVLGIKPESHSTQPAHYVPAYLASTGLDVIPVPVYYPEVTHILGKPVVRSLQAISSVIDVVDVFRRAEDIDAHIADIIAVRPKIVWFQSGIRNDAAAKKLTDAGILVVQDRCLMVDYRRVN